MDHRSKVFENFVALFNSWPNSLGQLKYNETPANISAIAEVPQSGVMRDYFERIGFSARPMIGADFGLQLYGPESLAKAQQGWHTVENEDPAWGWKDGFTVFADRNGDVLVFDRGDEHSPIFGSIQKRSFKVATDILALMGALQAGIAVQVQEFNNETIDEEQNYKPAFLHRVREVLGTVAGADVDGFMKFFFE